MRKGAIRVGHSGIDRGHYVDSVDSVLLHSFRIVGAYIRIPNVFRGTGYNVENVARD